MYGVIKFNQKAWLKLYIPSKHSSWWRRLEDVLKKSFVFVFRRRLQDVLIKTNIFVLMIRLQDILPRYLQDVLQKRLQGAFKTSLRRLQHVFKTSSRRFGNVFKTSLRHLQGVLQRGLQDFFKAYYQVKLFLLNCSVIVFKAFLRRLCTGRFAQFALLRNLW